MSVFVKMGIVLFFLGGLISTRYLYFFFFAAKKGGHLQSLLLSAILILMGFVSIVMGLLADVIASNRKLNEEILFKLKKMGIRKGSR
jgi:hypothetical protein